MLGIRLALGAERRDVPHVILGSGALMPKWKAWLALGAISALAGLLLWWGLAIVVRCDRVREQRVDVTVERRLFGWLTVTREVVQDVVRADVSAVRGRRGSATVTLELTPREGPVVRRTRFGPSFGTTASAAARQIQTFITAPSTPFLVTWWMPWLVNAAALPFLFIVGATLGEVLLRALGLIGPAKSPHE